MEDTSAGSDPAIRSRGKRLAQVSFICVHGIGKQRYGKTAEDVARAVEAGVEELGGTFARQPVIDDDHSTICQAIISLSSGETYEAKFHDGWWDETVTHPHPLVVLGWIWRVLPFALLTTIAFWMLDLMQVPHAPKRLQNEYIRALPAALLGFTAAFALPILTVLLVPLSALSLFLRIPKWFPEVLTLYLGDAWLYRSDRLDDSVIADVADLTRQVSAKADCTVLIGHSQGAEISRRVSLQTKVDGCVWVGSGEAQLGMLRILRRSRWLPPAQWVFLLAWPMAFSMLFQSELEGVLEILARVNMFWRDLKFYAAQGPSGIPFNAAEYNHMSDSLISFAWSNLKVSAAILALGLAWMFAAQKLSRPPSDLTEQPICEVLAVKSLIDPVCFGANKDGSVIRFVPPMKPYHREHIQYFAKRETGVAILEAVHGTESLKPPCHIPKIPLWVYTLGLVATVTLILLMAYVGSLELGFLEGLF